MNTLSFNSVLFLCVANSARSQMAEGLWNHFGAGEWRARSAGSNPTGYVHDLAKAAMSKVGLDISNARSKNLNEFTDEPIDLIVTVCDNAKDSCSALPNARCTLHWPFDDPAYAEGSEEEQYEVFRRVRDEIDQVFSAYGQGRIDSLS